MTLQRGSHICTSRALKFLGVCDVRMLAVSEKVLQRLWLVPLEWGSQEVVLHPSQWTACTDIIK